MTTGIGKYERSYLSTGSDDDHRRPPNGNPLKWSPITVGFFCPSNSVNDHVNRSFSFSSEETDCVKEVFDRSSREELRDTRHTTRVLYIFVAFFFFLVF